MIDPYSYTDLTVADRFASALGAPGRAAGADTAERYDWLADPALEAGAPIEGAFADPSLVGTAGDLAARVLAHLGA